MKSSRMYLTAGLIVLALACVFGQVTAQQAAPAGSGLTAVCDLAQVFQGYAKVMDQMTALQAMGKEIDAERERRENEIKQLQAEMEELRAGSDAYYERLDSLEMKVSQLDVWYKGQQAIVRSKHRRATQQMYNEILQAVQDVATQNGYQVVLNKTNPSLEGKSIEQLIAPQVLYSASVADMTQDVITRLNEQYKG